MKTIRQETPVRLLEQTTVRPFSWLPKVRVLAGKVLFNLIPIGIVAAFFWVQALIQRQGGDDWLIKVEIGMSAVVELGLVFIWNLFAEGK